MGGCCSADAKLGPQKDDLELRDEDERDDTRVVDGGAIVRLQGSSWCTSMYSRKGRKGTNQDAMTVWENFMGEKDTFLCSVFDGHGPHGHEVAQHARDNLPLRVSSALGQLPPNGCIRDANDHSSDDYSGRPADTVRDKNFEHHFVSNWEAVLTESFMDLDEQLELDDSIDSLCSGTAAVTLIKQGDYLLIANLGDSRAVLCTRGIKNQLIPVQLTVDLKPTVSSEAQRIQDAGGRIFALNEGPSVLRVWMPDEDCPGLAMARAFGDFCLKDCGLISTPDVSYRKIQDEDEFVVLATDGVWDVLRNDEVIRIVASVKDRHTAAKVLVYYAVQAWRTRYPGSKIDDCAAICLFLKKRPFLGKQFSDLNKNGAGHKRSACSAGGKLKKTDGGDTLINCDITVDRKRAELIRSGRNRAPRRNMSRRRAARNLGDVKSQRRPYPTNHFGALKNEVF